MGMPLPILPRFLELAAGSRRHNTTHDVFVSPDASQDAADALVSEVVEAADTLERLIVFPEQNHPGYDVPQIVCYSGGPRPEHGAEIRLAGCVPTSFTPMRVAEFAPPTGINLLTIESPADVAYLEEVASYVAQTGRIPSFLTGHRTVVADLDRIFAEDERLAHPTIVGSVSVSGVSKTNIDLVRASNSARRLIAVLAVSANTPGVGGEVELSGLGGPLFPTSFVDAQDHGGALPSWVIARTPSDYRLIHVGGRSQFRVSEDAARVLEAYQCTGDAQAAAVRVGCEVESVQGLVGNFELDGAQESAPEPATTEVA